MADRVYQLTLLIGLIGVVVLCVECARRGLRLHTHRVMFAGCMTMALWVVGTLVESLAQTPGGDWAGVMLIYTGTCAAPPAWFYLCHLIVRGEGGEQNARFTRPLLLGLTIPPAVLWTAMMTNPAHHLFIRGGTSPAWEYGPLWWVHNVYGFTLIALALLLLARHVHLAPRRPNRVPLWFVTAAVAATTAGCLAWVGGIIPPAYNPTAPAFAVLSVILGFTLFRSDYLDVLPLSAFAIFEHVGDGVVILDGAERIIGTNAAARRFLDIADAESVGQTFRDVAYGRLGWQEPPPAFVAGERVQAVLQGGGGPQALAVQCVRVSRQDDAAVHSAVHLRDITPEYRTEQQLRRSETAYRTLYTDAVDSIFTLDAQGHLIAANPATQQMVGYTDDDWKQMSFMDVILPEYVEVVAAAYERLMAGEAVTGLDYAIRRKDGMAVHLLASLRPVVQDGRVVRIEGIARDMTALRRAAEHKQSLEAELVQAQKLNALGRMLAGVAHELNNPLTGILGYAEMLEITPGTGPEQRRMARRILQSAEQCQAIVADLLSFAMNRPLEPEPVNAHHSVAAVVDAMQESLTKNDVRIEMDIPEHLWIHVDASHFRQCLMNLVQNAQDALTEVEDGRMIRFGAQGENGMVRLTIDDTGPGIDADLAARIFDPFFTTKSLGRGTGLGLSLCHTTMTNLGGTIQHDAGYTDGARFVLSVPRCEPSELPDRTPAASPVVPLHKRVIVADDNEDVREFCTACLTHRGYEVLCAEDGQGVLDLLDSERVDCIVSDIRMPNMDGPALHTALQARADAPAIVFITGDAVREETREFLGRTGAAYLPKPFRSAQLVDLVEHALARAQAPLA